MSSSFILLFPPPSLLRLHLCSSEGRPSSPGRLSWRVSHGSSEEMLAIKRHRGSIGLYTRGRSSQVFSVWCMCMCIYTFHPPFNLPSFLLTFLPILLPHLPSHPSVSPCLRSQGSTDDDLSLHHDSDNPHSLTDLTSLPHSHSGHMPLSGQLSGHIPGESYSRSLSQDTKKKLSSRYCEKQCTMDKCRTLVASNVLPCSLNLLLV